ncbi:MAG: peptidylprolyl isomerase, partial [Hyphomonadaceae bacterium]
NPGQVSTPLRTTDGVYILALRDRRAGSATATTARLGLRQISAPAANRQALERAGRRINGCEGLADVVNSVPHAEVTDLGTTAESDLSDTVRTQISGVDVGRASPIIVAGDRAAAIVVCSRETSTDGVPGHDEIENRLYEQDLAMLAQRYLRDLRREATIITR